MFHQTHTRCIVFAISMLGLALYVILGGFFAGEIVVKIAVLAIIAISIDVVAGFGGMVSLCHGAIMGLSAYTYGVLTVKFGVPALPASIAAIGVAATFGTMIGWVTGRTSGIFFIMATLAFGQMAYTLIFKSRWLGGDDGMGGLPRFDASDFGLDMNNTVTFAFYAIAGIVVCYAAAGCVLRSAFGRTLAGIHTNEARMKAFGVNTILHRARAMGFSSLLSGVAGIIAAQHTQYISPELLFWTVSGEALIVVILGGLGTLTGPVIGAMAFVLLKHQISSLTDYWHIVIGLLLILIVVSGGRGLFGQYEHWRSTHTQKTAKTNYA
ncbi:MAG: branched-chain amino acid ABC transporter permease [Rhodospirillales bacterium]